jgi:Rad3-related DNA helicase
VEVCWWCRDTNACPYRVAKRAAAFAPFSVLNTAYFLAETNSGGRSMFHGRELVVADEVDLLEDEIMGHVEVESTPQMRKRLGIRDLPKRTVPDDWVRWIRDSVIPAYSRAQNTVAAQLRQLSFSDPDPKLIRERRLLAEGAERYKNLVKLRVTSEGVSGAVVEGGWVLTGYEGEGDYDKAHLTFKPVRVDEIAQEKLWGHAKRWLLMSATLVSPEQMAADLGLAEGEWAVVEMESGFPVWRRPIYYQPAADMSFKERDVAWPKMAAAVRQVIDDHPGVRVLVHTVSYRLTTYLAERLRGMGRPIVTYGDSKGRDAALAEFLGEPDSVLLAPSFERGIDLPHDDCRLIVIAQLPYPYLKDKQVSARMHGKGGQVWYVVQTIRAVCQMTGRGMRSADDRCDSVILDARFGRMWREWKRLFPKWWRQAVILDVNDPKYRRRLQER